MDAEQDSYFHRVERRSNVDYMLRTTQQHHVHLSAMADQKASILVGAEAIMLTLLFNQLQNHGVQPALVVLTGFIFASAVFAFMAVMPRAKGAGPESPNFNWLFFGSFAQVEPETYFRHMSELLQNDAQVYHVILRDIHQLGTLLYRKKYRYLSIAYRLFLAGVVATVLTLVAEHVGLV